jgi:cell wall-associated NlpC family hydrolase
MLALAWGLTACGSVPVGDDPVGGSWSGQTGTSQGPSIGESVAGIAMRLKGVPYVYGGSTPAGFDCSGLVHYAYAQAGVQVPRTARAQMDAATQISPDHAQPGDLLFFHTKAGWHVAIYLGKDKFIHAPWPGIPVSTASLRNDFYREKLKAVGRLAPG